MRPGTNAPSDVCFLWCSEEVFQRAKDRRHVSLHSHPTGLQANDVGRAIVKDGRQPSDGIGQMVVELQWMPDQHSRELELFQAPKRLRVRDGHNLSFGGHECLDKLFNELIVRLIDDQDQLVLERRLSDDLTTLTNRP